MSKKLEKAFLDKLQKGECRQRIFFLYGSDSYLVNAYAKKLLSCIEAEDRMVVQDDNFHVDEVVDFAMTFSFMAGDKLLEIRNLELESLPNDEYEKLTALLLQFPEGVSVVFSYGSTVPNTKKDSRLMTLIGQLDDICGYMELNKGKEKLSDFIFAYVQKQGGIISKKTAAYIADMTPQDRQLLIQECEKLMAYANGKEITADMADLLVVRTVEASAFRMVDALTAGRVKEAVVILRRLIANREASLKILGAFATPFLDAYRCKVGAEAGISRKDIQSAFSIASDYRMEKGEAFAKRHSKKCLGDCIHQILLTDKSLKMGAADVDEGVRMEMLMANVRKLLAQDRGRP